MTMTAGTKRVPEKLAKTALTSVRFTVDKVKGDLPLWASKVGGGGPYLPIEESYPMSADGEPLRMLAQFNLAEVKKEAGALPRDWPEEGILSFWIQDDDELEYEDPGADRISRVLYFPEVLTDLWQLQTSFPVHYVDHTHELECEDTGEIVECTNMDVCLPEFGTINPRAVYKPHFEAEQQYMTTEDFRYETEVGDITAELVAYDKQEESRPQSRRTDENKLNDDEEGDGDGDNDDDTSQAHGPERFDRGGHRLGGYPCFIQDDPRSQEDKSGQYTEMLLQMDTDVFVMWGDAGVGHFFHTRSGLKERDFLGTFFTWDCS